MCMGVGMGLGLGLGLCMGYGAWVMWHGSGGMGHRVWAIGYGL